MKHELTDHLVSRVLSLSPSSRMRIASMIASSMVPSVPVEAVLCLLADRVCEAGGTDVRVRTDRRRDANVSRAVFVLACRLRGITLGEVGRFIGRSHSSVLYDERRMRDVLSCPESDKEVFSLYNRFVALQ